MKKKRPNYAVKRCVALRSVIVLLSLLLSINTLKAQEAFPPPTNSAPPLFKLSIALQWLPQSQFAGFYMARDQGFYREAGLEVALIHTGPGPSPLDFMERGAADFATLFLADAIVSADKYGLVNVAQLSQRSTLMLVGFKDMGILAPADLNGRAVSYWQSAFSAAFEAFFRQQGIAPVAVPQHYSVNLFLRRGVAACAVMEYNEYHRIFQAGVDFDELTLFRMSDFGLGFPEDGLYTTASFMQQHPEECRLLRQATMAGWEYARAHPAEVVATVLHESLQADVPANRPHTRWMLDHLLLSIFPAAETRPPGTLSRQDYTATAASLISSGLLLQMTPFEQFAPLEEVTP